MDVSVACYAGYTSPERPRAFVWQGARYEVAKVMARGRLPRGLWFRVRTSGGEVFDLTYTIGTEDWRVQSLDRETPVQERNPQLY